MSSCIKSTCNRVSIRSPDFRERSLYLQFQQYSGRYQLQIYSTIGAHQKVFDVHNSPCPNYENMASYSDEEGNYTPFILKKGRELHQPHILLTEKEMPVFEVKKTVRKPTFINISEINDTLGAEVFCRDYIVEPSGEYLIMYSDFQISSCLKAVNAHLIIDTTSICFPKEYAGLFTAHLHSYQTGQGSPIFFAFLSNKSVEAYEFVLGKLKEMLEIAEVKMCCVTCELDKDIQEAVRKIFMGTEIVQSFYQYMNALWGKCKKYALLEKARKKTKSMLFSLASLVFMDGAVAIKEKMEKIIDKYLPICKEYEEFFKYFQKKWIDGVDAISKWQVFEKTRVKAGRAKLQIASCVPQKFNNILKGLVSPDKLDVTNTISALKQLAKKAEVEKSLSPQETDKLLGYFLKAIKEGKNVSALPCISFDENEYSSELEVGSKKTTPKSKGKKWDTSKGYLDYNAARCASSNDTRKQDESVKLCFEPKKEDKEGVKGKFRKARELTEKLFPSCIDEEEALLFDQQTNYH
eukprot:TRINITY_DN90476_c0_g1_i1.p1 TRINITY_DN90476_c0_g1~~TRINITY_DN90476_c0_g1_i1.p1  ORF type:complete len:546 (+),score=68.59 TRINITY_DN90476_c0_g1_i1:76-1638(+)